MSPGTFLSAGDTIEAHKMQITVLLGVLTVASALQIAPAVQQRYPQVNRRCSVPLAVELPNIALPKFELPKLPPLPDSIANDPALLAAQDFLTFSPKPRGESKRGFDEYGRLVPLEKGRKRPPQGGFTKDNNAKLWK